MVFRFLSVHSNATEHNVSKRIFQQPSLSQDRRKAEDEEEEEGGRTNTNKKRKEIKLSIINIFDIK